MKNLPDQFAGMLVAGVDEAGRGPLAGPVVAAAVILPVEHPVSGIDDSKKLTHKTRSRLAALIKTHAVGWSIACIEAEEIDRINILQATMRAMSQALFTLPCPPDHALIDGNRCPSEKQVQDLKMSAVVGGDATYSCIAAASILAKDYRDELMIAYHDTYPQYGFDRHKGYPTAAHLSALRDNGPIGIHRRSFKPVRESEQQADQEAPAR